MSLDPAVPRSRRALLGGALGALAAMAAQAIGRPLPVDAGGQSLILGQSNTSDAASTTLFRADDATNVSFIGPTFGVIGHAFVSDGTGIIGQADTAGATGMLGRTEGKPTQTAIRADTTNGLGEGISLRAETHNGIAVWASCTGGAAIVADGLTEFSRSGKAAFATGQASRTIKPGRMTADTLVVATIQGAVPGTWVLGVSLNVTKQSFTIRLNKAAPTALKVGWFVVN